MGYGTRAVKVSDSEGLGSTAVAAGPSIADRWNHTIATQPAAAIASSTQRLVLAKTTRPAGTASQLSVAQQLAPPSEAAQTLIRNVINTFMFNM
jgi:hypothetical protein